MRTAAFLFACLAFCSLDGLTESPAFAQGHSIGSGSTPSLARQAHAIPYEASQVRLPISQRAGATPHERYDLVTFPQRQSTSRFHPQSWNGSNPYQTSQVRPVNAEFPRSRSFEPQPGDLTTQFPTNSAPLNWPTSDVPPAPSYGPRAFGPHSLPGYPSSPYHSDFNGPSDGYRLPQESAPFSSEHAGPIDGDEAQEDLVTLFVPGRPLGDVLALIAQQHGLNVVSGDDVSGLISVTLKDVPLAEALDSILTVNGYTWTRKGNILLVSRISTDTRISAAAQGRVLKVFPLSYVSAADVEKVVTGLLSPVGNAVITQTDTVDTRRTREEIVIEDLPDYITRIAAYIAQIDRPPLQVSIEAHVLQVDLKDDTNHGVNFQKLLDISDTRVTLETTGFADDTADPAFFLGIDGNKMDGLIEALKQTTDAKTLASPKVLVLNGQEARIQVGESLGYLVTTTTQTSTLQNVDFLDVGVVLNVAPIISQDGRILMQVKPEVSGGRINPDTGLPDRDTTEVETTVMLDDGQGMVIGGLIKEEDTEIQSKLPIAGDLWLVGRAFQRRSHLRERSEIIIALVPHILPYDNTLGRCEEIKLERAQTPLLEGPLRRVDRRSWEPELPDAMRDPRRISRRIIPDSLKNLKEPYPNPKEYYFPAISEEASGLYGPYGYQVPPSQVR
ncbi:MAG: secretin and TonB N-terminal domain-containing protein [Planctomycetaceae bacterium]|nr:secretin and TonB N-terminal domain-containing protein [Planctomycetaceae bacterium]